jgi:uncharacterized protein (DUF4415 family)
MPAMTKIVRKILTDRRLTSAGKRGLAGVAESGQSVIDLSDIPELTDKFWQNAVRNPFYRPIKLQLTLRLDADVVAWLRRQGKGYQTRANALLRAAMLGDADRRRNAKAARRRNDRERRSERQRPGNKDATVAKTAT